MLEIALFVLEQQVRVGHRVCCWSVKVLGEVFPPVAHRAAPVPTDRS